MSNSEVQDAIDLIKGYSGRKHFVGGRPSALISAAEVALGIEFPPSYRRFLEELGAGSIEGREVFGLINENFSESTVPNGIWLTLRERQDSRLPHGLVVISDIGDGDYFVLDTDKSDEDGESPVVVWSPGVSSAGDRLELIAGNFGSFLLQLVKEATG